MNNENRHINVVYVLLITILTAGVMLYLTQCSQKNVQKHKQEQTSRAVERSVA